MEMNMNMKSVTEVQNIPWYCEFWVWFVIALPLSAVLPGFTTLWIAIGHADVELGGPEQPTGFVMHGQPPPRRQ